MPIVRASAPKYRRRKSAKPSKPLAATIVTAKNPRRWRYEPPEPVESEGANAKAKEFLDRMMRPARQLGALSALILPYSKIIHVEEQGRRLSDWL